MLPLLLFALPLFGGAILAACPRIADGPARVTGFVFSLGTLVLALVAILCQPSASDPPFSFEAGTAHSLGIALQLQLGPNALMLALLTGIIAPAALLASWKLPRARLFNILFLLMQSAATGVFLAQNFVFWFLCWELSLFPAFFLIKLWGGRNAGRAATQFVIYTIGGSAFILLAFAAIYAATGCLDFEALRQIPDLSGTLAGKFGTLAPMFVCLGTLVGLAVKVPMFPFHTWLPAAYAGAPTGVAMFLTAVMSKMGLYGFLLFPLTFFRQEMAVAAPWLLWLALAGIVLGAYAAMRQDDLKRMVAYSSVNHLGYCLLAIFAIALAAEPGTPVGDAGLAMHGTLLQMFNHGLSASALFFCVGVLENRSGSRGLGDFGGVRKVAPVFTTLCGVALFSSLGLPGLNGFVGEFMIFRGVFGITPWAAVAATPGLLVTAVFLLTFWQKVFHGSAGVHTGEVTDLGKREIFALVPIAVLMVLLGVWPQLLLNLLGAK